MKLYSYWGGGKLRASVDLRCACGKKDWKFKDAEALSAKEAEFYYLQTLKKGKNGK